MSVLTTFDPFFRTGALRDWERLTDSVGARRAGSHPMPVDVYRHGEEFVVRIDLPGIDPGSVEVTVEKNVLSVTAERSWAPEEGDRVLVAERPQGRYSRRLQLGQAVDTDGIEAHYDRGVLALRIPVTAQARSRRILVSTGAPATVATGAVDPPATEVTAPSGPEVGDGGPAAGSAEG